MHQNHTLHTVNRGLHCNKKLAIDRVIQAEFIIGKDKLDDNMISFFRGEVHHILKASFNSKMQQLASIWGKRDRVRVDRGLSTQYKESLAEAFLV